MPILKNATIFSLLPVELVEQIYADANTKQETKRYFKQFIAPLIDVTVQFVSNNRCVACYMKKCFDTTEMVFHGKDMSDYSKCVLYGHTTSGSRMVSAHSHHLRKLSSYRILEEVGVEAWFESMYLGEFNGRKFIGVRNEVKIRVKLIN